MITSISCNNKHHSQSHVREAVLHAKAPSCDGAMLSGPVRRNKYSAAIPALPTSELARVLSVATLETLKIRRI
jgi:hypothetical protein